VYKTLETNALCNMLKKGIVVSFGKK